MTDKVKRTAKKSDKQPIQEKFFSKFGLFRQSSLLSYEDMKTLKTSSILPNDKAKIVSDALLNYCFLNVGKLYILNSNNYYERFECKELQEGKIKSLVTQLLQASFENLTDEGKDGLKGDDRLSSSFVTMMNDKGVNGYYTALITFISKDHVKMDYGTEWQLHFLNGYYDLKDNTFKPRVLGTHYVSRVIPREYHPSKKNKRQELMNIVSKIYPNEDDRNVVLSHIGRALSGVSDIDQLNMFLLGLASSGKSMIMQITKFAIGDYMVELGSNTFELRNKNIDKILNEFDINPIIRIAWINEMSDKKTDDTLFKTFCEGKVKACKLYKEGNHDINLYCTLFFTSNDMANIKIDGGSKRRILAYEHTSEFVCDADQVDEDNHGYLKDSDLKLKLKEDHQILNAWIDILVGHCSLWRDKQAPKETERFNLAKDSIVSSNDIMQDFIDKCLIITNVQEDRIGKNRMRELFIKMYPNKHMSVQQILSSLKQKGIDYSPKCRADGIQGCYCGVKESDDIDEVDVSALQSKRKKSDRKKSYEELETENAILKEQLENLRQLMNEKEVKPKQKLF